MNNIPRQEHPNPMWQRDAWINLNGKWQFEIDNVKSGIWKDYPNKDTLSGEIIVPFCPESELSGVNNKDFMYAVWYKRTVNVDEFKSGRTILHIGACDYRTTIWVNGKQAATHFGGYTPISCDITDFLHEGDNMLTVYAEDDTRAPEQPTGKQAFRLNSWGCFYTRTTGIWQTVWLENVPDSYITKARYMTDIGGGVKITAQTKNASGKELRADVYYKGEHITSGACTVCGTCGELSLKIDEPKLWSVDSPSLYDLVLTMGEDVVKSYFGIRSVGVENHKLYLNGEEIFGRFILDQGYYPDGIYTAPTKEALENDILLSQKCGYNGARLHQKIFEPRFLYYCDLHGYMVWGEHANWELDISRPEAYKGFISEWCEALDRDFNHPSIIGWCPFNETQANQDNDLLATVYRLTKTVDMTRPVIETSGWVHVEGCCDMLDAHNYKQDPEEFARALAEYVHQSPDMCFISEFGGTRWTGNTATDTAWGYGTAVNDSEEFLNRYAALIKAVYDNPAYCAFCYTQLTDVEQEENGLYTYDRRPKFDTDKIALATKGLLK